MVVVMAELIGTTEAAQRKGVDRSTFFRWVQLGHISPVMRLPGKTGAMLFDPSEVDALRLPAEPAGQAS
jgi:predicted site-specific integrase-resolvase